MFLEEQRSFDRNSKKSYDARKSFEYSDEGNELGDYEIYSRASVYGSNRELDNGSFTKSGEGLKKQRAQEVSFILKRTLFE